MDIPLVKQQPLGFHRDCSESDEHSSVCGARPAHLRTTLPAHRIAGPATESISTCGLSWHKVTTGTYMIGLKYDGVC